MMTQDNFDDSSTDYILSKIAELQAVVASRSRNALHVPGAGTMTQAAQVHHGTAAAAAASSRNALQVPGAGTMTQAAQVHHGTTAAAPAPVVVHHRLSRARPRYIRDLTDDEAAPKFQKLFDKFLRDHAPLAAKVDGVISLRDVCKHVFDARRDEQGSGNSQKPHTTHLALINGDIQRGKTNIKVAQAIMMNLIHKDPELLDRGYTTWITIQVPWARQAKQSIDRVVGDKSDEESAATATARPDTRSSIPYDLDSSDDDSQSYDDVDTNDEDTDFHVDDVRGAVGPYVKCSFISTKADFEKGLQAAREGGIIVIARTLKQIKKAIELRTVLAEESKAQGNPLYWPIIELDEVDRMLGSCNTGGYDNGQSVRVTQYEKYLWILCGFEGKEKIEFRDGSAVKIRSIRAKHAPPCLVTAISATNQGTFVWALHRVGALYSKRQNIMRFNLLDIISMKESNKDKYISLDDAARFNGLTYDEKELSCQNDFVCDKTLAIHSHAAQKPGSCIMAATTPTVNETATRGRSQMRVANRINIDMLIQGRLNRELHGVKIGFAEAGRLTFYMHGGEKSFDGQIGCQFTSPSDPFGLEYWSRFRDLAKVKKIKVENEVAGLRDQINTPQLQKVIEQKERLIEDLAKTYEGLDKRIKHSNDRVPRLRQLIDDAVHKYKQADAAQVKVEAANANNTPVYVIENLMADAEDCKEMAHNAKEKAIEQAIKEAASSGDGEARVFKRAWVFGIELLCPLVQMWEEKQREINPEYNKAVPLRDKRRTVMKCSHLVPVLGFFRTSDDDEDMCRLYADNAYQHKKPANEDMHSRKCPHHVAGMGMLRRSMNVIGVNETGEKTEAVLSITHVEQYSGHDGASQAQQTQRFCTTLVDWVRDFMKDDIQVLTTELGWTGMHGHVAYNNIPLFRLPTEERRIWLKEIKDCITGNKQLPELPEEKESEISRICQEPWMQNNNTIADVTATSERIIRVLAHCMPVPQAMYNMVVLFKNGLFAGSAGMDCSMVVARAAEVRAVSRGTVSPSTNLPQRSSKHKGSKVNMVDKWVITSMENLLADTDQRSWTHREIHDKLKQTFSWILDDDTERKKVEDVHPAALKFLREDKIKTGGGGVGHYLSRFFEKNIIGREKKASPYRYYLLAYPPKESPQPEVGGGGGSSSSNAKRKRPEGEDDSEDEYSSDDSDDERESADSSDDEFDDSSSDDRDDESAGSWDDEFHNSP